MNAFMGSFAFFVLFLGLVLLGNAVRVVREYDRLVVSGSAASWARADPVWSCSSRSSIGR